MQGLSYQQIILKINNKNIIIIIIDHNKNIIIKKQYWKAPNWILNTQVTYDDGDKMEKRVLKITLFSMDSKIKHQYNSNERILITHHNTFIWIIEINTLSPKRNLSHRKILVCTFPYRTY